MSSLKMGENIEKARVLRFVVSILVLVCLTQMATAEIIVHEAGFVVDKVMDRIDGQTPRLEIISNPAYGHGVVAATVDKSTGILTVFRISSSSIDVLGVLTGLPTAVFSESVITVRFDNTNRFDNKLLISLGIDPDMNSMYTNIYQMSSQGDFLKINEAPLGGGGDELGFSFAIAPNDLGYEYSMYLYDADLGDGSSFWVMSDNYVFTRISQHFVPSGRRDLDVLSMDFDPTGEYGGYLTMTDSDYNQDKISVIYQLLPDLTWSVLAGPRSTNEILYGDMSFSTAGTLGEMLYVTETRSDSVMSVDPNGLHITFASGFSAVSSVAIANTGEAMYVSDSNGVWRIQTGIPGPQIVMQEHKVPEDEVFTGERGVSAVRLLWSEPVEFSSADVEILNEDGESIPASVAGSGSQFMIIAFGETLLHDIYTISIGETVVSVDEGVAIDGDNDGFSGGDAVIAMEHRERHDSDNDNDIDFYDLANFANKWLWME